MRTYVLSSLIILVGCFSCRTAGPAESDLLSKKKKPDVQEPSTPGTDDEGTECGRGGQEPICKNGQICIVAENGVKGGICMNNPDKNAPKNATLLRKVSKTPINGGINPEFSALQVTAEVMIGSNTCQAKGKTAKLVQVKGVANSKLRVTHVWPVAEVTGKEETKCTREFKPVFKKVTLEIHSLRSGLDRVIIHGISDPNPGDSTAEIIFGDKCSIPLCSAPKPGCRRFDPQPRLLDEEGCLLMKCGVMECQNSPGNPGGNVNCTAEAGQLFNPVTESCQGFTNGCQKSALKAEGLIDPPAGKCDGSSSEPIGRFCTAEAGRLYNPSNDSCQGFSDGCQKSALMGSGFVTPPAGKCE
ncbi:MAG: hypothetical protein NT027_07150 [Proteobacteria bacterium]|nr:hypothetical protein [Pseudomonadota bacterium]